MLISIAMVATEFDVPIHKQNARHQRINRDRKVEIIPDPGPISNNRDGCTCWMNEILIGFVSTLQMGITESHFGILLPVDMS